LEPGVRLPIGLASVRSNSSSLFSAEQGREAVRIGLCHSADRVDFFLGIRGRKAFAEAGMMSTLKVE